MVNPRGVVISDLVPPLPNPVGRRLGPSLGNGVLDHPSYVIAHNFGDRKAYGEASRFKLFATAVFIFLVDVFLSTHVCRTLCRGSTCDAEPQ